LIFLENFLN